MSFFIDVFFLVTEARDLEGVQIKAVNSVELSPKGTGGAGSPPFSSASGRAVSRGAEVLAYWEQLFRRWPGPSLWSPRPLCRASRRSRFRLSKFMRQVQASGNVFADGSFGIQFEDAKLEPLAEGA